MMSIPTGKIALITGGSRGLGRAMALSLAERGTDVLLTYLSNHAEAEKTIADIRAVGRTAHALPLDSGDSASFPAFVDSVGQTLSDHWQRTTFDALINNAGIGLTAPFTETSEQMFDRLMSIHLKGVFFLTQGLLPLIADGGAILNISTGLSRFSLPGFAAYASMKGAVEVLTRYLAKELGPRRITANTIAPGPIETDFGGGTVRDTPQINAFLAQQTALGRVGLADDIGNAVAALLSSDSRWVNGQRIEVGGGIFL